MGGFVYKNGLLTYVCDNPVYPKEAATPLDIFKAAVESGYAPVDGGDSYLLDYCEGDPVRMAEFLGITLEK